MQAQIFDDLSNDALSAGTPFDMGVQLPPEYGGQVDEIPENILNHETLNDLELRVKLLSKEVPTVDTIYR